MAFFSHLSFDLTTKLKTTPGMMTTSDDDGDTNPRDDDDADARDDDDTNPRDDDDDDADARDDDDMNPRDDNDNADASDDDNTNSREHDSTNAMEQPLLLHLCMNTWVFPKSLHKSTPGIPHHPKKKAFAVVPELVRITNNIFWVGG